MTHTLFGYPITALTALAEINHTKKLDILSPKHSEALSFGMVLFTGVGNAVAAPTHDYAKFREWLDLRDRMFEAGNYIQTTGAEMFSPEEWKEIMREEPCEDRRETVRELGVEPEALTTNAAAAKQLTSRLVEEAAVYNPCSDLPLEAQHQEVVAEFGGSVTLTGYPLNAATLSIKNLDTALLMADASSTTASILEAAEADAALDVESRLYFHPESSSYFYDTQHPDDGLSFCVTGMPEHEEAARKQFETPQSDLEAQEGGIAEVLEIPVEIEEVPVAYEEEPVLVKDEAAPVEDEGPAFEGSYEESTAVATEAPAAPQEPSEPAPSDPEDFDPFAIAETTPAPATTPVKSAVDEFVDEIAEGNQTPDPEVEKVFDEIEAAIETLPEPEPAPRVSKTIPPALRPLRPLCDYLQDVGVAPVILQQFIANGVKALDRGQLTDYKDAFETWSKGKDGVWIEVNLGSHFQDWVDGVDNLTKNPQANTAIAEILARVPDKHKDANKAIIQGFIDLSMTHHIAPNWAKVKNAIADGRPVAAPIALWKSFMKESTDGETREKARRVDKLSESEIHELFRPFVPDAKTLDEVSDWTFWRRREVWKQKITPMATLGWGGSIYDFWDTFWHGEEPRASEHRNALFAICNTMKTEERSHVKTPAQTAEFLPDMFKRLLAYPLPRLNTTDPEKMRENAYQQASSLMEWLKKYKPVIDVHPIFGPILAASEVSSHL